MTSNVLRAKIASQAQSIAERTSSGEFPIYGKSRISVPVLRGVVAAIDAVIFLGAGLAAAFATGMLIADRQSVGLIVVLGTVLAINVLHLSGAYELEAMGRLKSSLGILALGIAISFTTLLSLAAIAEVPAPVLNSWLPLWFAVNGGALAAVRTGLRQRIAVWRRKGRIGENVAVVGAGPIAHRLLYSMVTVPDRGCRIVGVYDDRRTRIQRHCAGHRVMGTVEDLIWEIRSGYVDIVVLALPLSAERRIREILDRLGDVAVDIRICPDQFGLQLGRFEVSHFGGSSVLNVVDRPLRHWREIAKSVEDRVLASLILLLISPLLLAIAIAIKWDSPGPVLFRQNRWGYNNRIFKMLKFRTMHHAMTDHEATRLVSQGDARVTRIGRFLRRTSLDELPQFINVLRGEMSIVGPRAHALAVRAGELLYQDAVRNYDSRHRVKPGITGWAQINGWRGETRTVEQIVRRVEHDLYYIRHWSVVMDLKIILKTILGGFTGPLAY